MRALFLSYFFLAFFVGVGWSTCTFYARDAEIGVDRLRSCYLLVPPSHVDDIIKSARMTLDIYAFKDIVKVRLEPLLLTRSLLTGNFFVSKISFQILFLHIPADQLPSQARSTRPSLNFNPSKWISTLSSIASPERLIAANMISLRYILFLLNKFSVSSDISSCWHSPVLQCISPRSGHEQPHVLSK